MSTKEERVQRGGMEFFVLVLASLCFGLWQQSFSAVGCFFFAGIFFDLIIDGISQDRNIEK